MGVFVVTPSPLFTLSLNVGKQLFKVNLLGSMTFLCTIFFFIFVFHPENGFSQASRLISPRLFYQLIQEPFASSSSGLAIARRLLFTSRLRLEIGNQNVGTFIKVVLSASQSQTHCIIF
jgi:hypothetical protein